MLVVLRVKISPISMGDFFLKLDQGLTGFLGNPDLKYSRGRTRFFIL